MRLLLYAVVAGAIVQALLGAVVQAAQGGQRDITSVTGIQPDHYDVQVDEAVADQARDPLARMPAGRG